MNRAIRLLTLIMISWLPALALTAHATLETDNLPYISRFVETPPPAGPVRPIAEFEPASQVLIRYPLGIPVSLVAQLSNTAQVVCIVSSASVQNSATSAFNNGGVNMANVSFLIAATDSYWTRDYGPWFIFDGNDEYSVVDFRYNRPRPNDNLIPEVFANQNGINLYGMNLYQTGGNYMTDGINTAAQTTIAYSENSSLTQAQVNAKMHDYMGITSYHVLPDPNNTYIDHIDCWGKFLAPDKVLIRSVPSSHAQYNAIEQTAAYFANLNCAWGYPYKVYRVNTPQNQPYTNSLILNHKVFVPIMNGSYDAAALQAYRDAMPGYEVIGVSGASSTPWESTDALHCRAHEIPDAGMLEISHMPYWGTRQAPARLDFNAVIKARSGQALIADSTFVCYQVNSGTWQYSYLANVSGNDYTAMITGFAPGDTIRYFIHAADASGRSISHPYFEALDPHVFSLLADTQSPGIVHYPYAVIPNEPVVFSAVVTDNVQVQNVLLRWRIDHGAVNEVEMVSMGDDVWQYEFYPEFVSGDDVFYYQIEAYDTAAPPNSTVYPEAGQWVEAAITGVSNGEEVSPVLQNGLKALYPNPFRSGSIGRLTIKFDSEEAQPVVLTVFNSKGQLVYRSGEQAAIRGENVLNWSGVDNKQQKLSSGVYLIRLKLGSKMLTHKVLLLD
jgi:agmatine/peptidylarginine deiminase